MMQLSVTLLQTQTLCLPLIDRRTVLQTSQPPTSHCQSHTPQSPKPQVCKTSPCPSPSPVPCHHPCPLVAPHACRTLALHAYHHPSGPCHLAPSPLGDPQAPPCLVGSSHQGLGTPQVGRQTLGGEGVLLVGAHNQVGVDPRGAGLAQVGDPQGVGLAQVGPQVGVPRVSIGLLLHPVS